MGMTGSRGSDYVKNPFHFPLLLFYIVAYSQVSQVNVKTPPSSLRITSPQHSHARGQSCAFQVAPKRFGLNFIEPFTCLGRGIEQADWPSLKHMPIPSKRGGSGRCFPRGDGRGCQKKEEVLGGKWLLPGGSSPGHAMQTRSRNNSSYFLTNRSLIDF